MDEALEMYNRAGNLYKMGKKWSSAGNTFVTVAQHHVKLGNKHDAATSYVDAANCYKKSDPQGKIQSSWSKFQSSWTKGLFKIISRQLVLR